MQYDDTVVARFWSKVDRTGDCWLWTASTNHWGYGRFYPKHGRCVKAHRFAYELEHGPDSAGGWCVLHRCDNPPCVRPEHLFLGTFADNMADMYAKGRDRHVSLPGELNHTSKLNADAVREIRRAHAVGEANYTELAARFRVSRRTIKLAVLRETWEHVP